MDGITTSTILGIAEPSAVVNIDPKRAKLYWETFIQKGGLEEKLAYNIDLPNIDDKDDLISFIDEFEDENGQEQGFLTFMCWVINNLENTKNLPITVASDDSNRVLGVFEIQDYPWNMQQYVDDAKENNITKERICETLTQHWYMLFQSNPTIDEFDLEFFC